MILPKVDVNKILYPTDLSEHARYAFAYAISLANLYGASLTILHVLFEDSNIGMMASHYIGEKNWEIIRKRNFEEAREALIGKRRDNIAIQEVLEKFCETVKNDVNIQTPVTDEIIVERGNPADQIVLQAEKNNCDLIVMGSHGHGILTEAMIGSTVGKVLRHTTKPVVVVRLPKED
ncbi:MAG: universal stress protein [Desulfobacterales bacterium]|nr:universal stress protein [Desulfobacterales bacterium]